MREVDADIYSTGGNKYALEDSLVTEPPFGLMRHTASLVGSNTVVQYSGILA